MDPEQEKYDFNVRIEKLVLGNNDVTVATRNDCIAARYIDLQNDIYKAINREELDKDELIYCRRKILFFIQDLRRDPNMSSEEQSDILDLALNLKNKLQIKIDEL